MVFSRFKKSLIGILFGFLSVHSANCYADHLVSSFSDPQVAFELQETVVGQKPALQLRIQKKSVTGSTVFSLADPNRIVVDLAGPSLKKNKSVLVENDSIIGNIRLGAYPDKVRLVLDIKTALIPPYQWSESNNKVIITFNRDGSAPSGKSSYEPIATSPTPHPTPPPLEKATETPVPKPTIVPTTAPTVSHVEPTHAPVITPQISAKPTLEIVTSLVPLATATKAAGFTPEEILNTAEDTNGKAPVVIVNEAEGQQAVRNISFAYSEDSKPTIMIALKDRPEFEVTRKDEKTYSLSIKNCQISRPQLKLVQFPPHDFVGFSFISAEEQEGMTSVTIGVEKNSRISATPINNEIWIRIAEENKTITKSPPKPSVKNGQPQLKVGQ